MLSALRERDRRRPRVREALIAALLPGVAELDWLQFLATLGLLGFTSGLLGQDLYAVMLPAVVGSALLPALALRRGGEASTPGPL